MEEEQIKAFNREACNTDGDVVVWEDMTDEEQTAALARKNPIDGECTTTIPK